MVNGPCGRGIVTEFLQNPRAQLSIACAAQEAKPDFRVPESLSTTLFGTADAWGILTTRP